MYNIILNKECSDIIKNIREDNDEINSIKSIFEPKTAQDGWEASKIINQQLKACDALEQQLNAIRSQPEENKVSIGKIRAFVKSQDDTFSTMLSVVLEQISNYYENDKKEELNKSNQARNETNLLQNTNTSCLKLFSGFNALPQRSKIAPQNGSRSEDKNSEIDNQKESLNELKFRQLEFQKKFDEIISSSLVCDSQEKFQSLCDEIKKIDKFINESSDIVFNIFNDIVEEKAEKIGDLKQKYIEAKECFQERLLKAQETIVNRYIDGLFTGNNLSESIRKYGVALRIAIPSLAEDNPNRTALQKKEVTLNNLRAQGSFISMCGGIDSLAQHGDAMVSRFFTTGTVGAQDVCRTLSQDLKVAVIKCLKDEITEVELVQAIDSTATPFITDMKNRNVFSKVAKFFAGIIEFIGRCAGYQPDFFKPKRKALAEAVVTQAKSLNNSQSVH